MANSNTQGFGLIPLGTLGSGYSNQGQSKYVVDRRLIVTLTFFKDVLLE